MKFTVASKPLTAIASAVSKIINAKNTLTILNNFLFDVSGTTLTVSAGDGENYLMGRVRIDDVENAGRVCVPAKALVDLLRAMPELELKFEIDDSTHAIKMSHPDGNYDFMGEDATNFPAPADMAEQADAEHTVNFEASGEKLIRGLEVASVGIATDTIRPQMNGVCLDVREDKLVFVATDTHKLVKFVDLSVHGDRAGIFILPSRTVAVFRGVFLASEEVKVSIFPDKGVRFQSETYSFDSRLVKGRFPDYDRVIPQNNDFTFSVDRVMFTNAVRRMGVFVANSDAGLVKLKLEPERVTIKTLDTQYNNLGIETLPCSYDQDLGFIGFKFQFLMEVLSVLWTERVVMKLKDQSRPAVVLPQENKPETELTILLMPMNMGDF